MQRKRVAALCAAATAMIVAGWVHRAAGEERAGASSNWALHGGGTDESNYSPLGSIKADNIGRLGLAWSLDLADEVTLEATPLAVDGILYFTGSYAAVYAVDARSGRLLWKYDPQTWKYNPAKQAMNFGANRGVAYANGRIYSAVLDGRLIALEAGTGRLLWSVDTVPRDDFHTVTGAPCVFNGKVIIGNAGADSNMRGYVTAYDQATGRQLWRFYLAPGRPEENRGNPAMEAAAKTWGHGEYWKSGTGGTVWNGITFDPELNRIYLGTGNASPWNPRVRDPGGGDNLYTAAIVALNADTGQYAWHYQLNPRESWDYDADEQMTLADLVIGGARHRVLMQAPKNGFFYVLDRDTGRLISAGKIGTVTWADHIDRATGRPVEAPNVRYETGETILYPSMLGAHNWQSMSFDPQTGLVYIPYMQLGARYTTRAKPGEFVFGGMTPEPYLGGPEDGHGALVAWDPVAQQARWRAPIGTIWNGGTLATAGKLVFQGTGDGYFSAYDARTGQRLWRFNAGLGIVAAPISYAVNGRQYVSVLVGYGGTTAAVSDILNAGWKFGAQPRRLLTFSLDGTAVLPPSPARDMTAHALDDPALQIDEQAARAGQALSIACLACHGPGFRGAGSPAPDLRESQLALSEPGFQAVVHDGTLMKLGMPRFDSLSPEQVHDLYMYVRATAREAAVGHKPIAGQSGESRH